MNKTVTIIIFDKHNRLQRRILDRLYEITDNILYTDSKEILLTSSRRHAGDLFILGLDQAHQEAYSVCRYLREESNVPVIFITHKCEPAFKANAYKCGGDICFSEDCDPEEFLAACERLIKSHRDKTICKHAKEILSYGSLIVNTESLTAFTNGTSANLTTKEMLILLLLMKKANQTVSSREIYETVWGKNFNSGSCVLRTHISNLKNKIGTDSTDDYDIVAIRGEGYSFVTT